ncbi:MAG: hypothetical protein CL878_05505 [Dehalococcoidia bacterium]|nr:hypothetical protein [Dehalococcoidia bacterium]
MSSQQSSAGASSGTRRFARYPVAVLAIIVNEREELLLFRRQRFWEVISGGLEANETVLEGALREVREEAGPEMQARPLGTVHTESFFLDAQAPYMVSVSFLLAYEGGPIRPGSDMAGSQYRWWSVAALQSERIPLRPPLDRPWLWERAVELYRLWRHHNLDLDPYGHSPPR